MTAPTNADRVEVPADAFLRRTGQLWKLVVASLVLPWPAVAIGFWFLRRLGPDQPAAEVILSIGSLVVLAALIVLLMASVRCPRCGTRLLGTVVSAPQGLDALTGFLNARTCPACGYDPGTAARG